MRRLRTVWRPSSRCLLAVWMYAFAWSLTPMLVNQPHTRWIGLTLWAGTAFTFGVTLAQYQLLLARELLSRTTGKAD